MHKHAGKKPPVPFVSTEPIKVMLLSSLTSPSESATETSPFSNLHINVTLPGKHKIQCLLHQKLSLGKVKLCAKFGLSALYGSGDKGTIAPLACPDQVYIPWSTNQILESP